MQGALILSRADIEGSSDIPLPADVRQGVSYYDGDRVGTMLWPILNTMSVTLSEDESSVDISEDTISSGISEDAILVNISEESLSPSVSEQSIEGSIGS